MVGVYGRIILRCIFRKWDVAAWTEPSWFSIGTGRGNWWVTDRIEIFCSAIPFVIFIDVIKKRPSCDYSLME
jgi:hypothetical protein